jgi:hypothetical protein
LFFVVGGAGPGFLLRFAVVVAGQFLDRGNEDRRQHIGVSAARNGRSAGLGSVCPIASKYSEQLQRKHDAPMITAHLMKM